MSYRKIRNSFILYFIRNFPLFLALGFFGSSGVNLWKLAMEMKQKYQFLDGIALGVQLFMYNNKNGS